MNSGLYRDQDVRASALRFIEAMKPAWEKIQAHMLERDILITPERIFQVTGLLSAGIARHPDRSQDTMVKWAIDLMELAESVTVTEEEER